MIWVIPAIKVVGTQWSPVYSQVYREGVQGLGIRFLWKFIHSTNVSQMPSLCCLKHWDTETDQKLPLPLRISLSM